MYEVGKVYIWQNMDGDCEFLNGDETIVIGLPSPAKAEADGQIHMFQYTSTMWDGFRCMAARAGQLRPKNPPSGEKKVRELFEPKPVMEPA